MRIWQKNLFCISLILMCIFCCVGYASITGSLSLNAEIEAATPQSDIYITDVTPGTSAGISIKTTPSTVMFMQVFGSGTARFNVDFINVSDKAYVYDRVIDGAELNIEGVYSGTNITYKLSGVTSLQEISANGGTLSLDIEITVPAGVVAELYALKFNFIEKTGTEILPGQDDFTITFKYNNGTPDTVIKLHKDEFIPRPDVPVRSGYKFTGWYKDEGCTLAWNFDTDKVAGEMTLYAGWEEVPTAYIVTFSPNNGDESYTVIAPAGELLPVPTAPVMDGFVFAGWYKDASLSSAWNFDIDRVNGNVTLYGAWDIYVPPAPPYLDITFKPNNGEADTTIVVMTGEFIPRPQVPQKEGYRFIGWYVDESCTVAWNFEAQKPEYHMTLYAGWEEVVSYTVTFKHNNGMGDITVTVEDGSLIPPPATPIRTGYTFIGWYLDETLKTAWNLDTDKPSSNITLYAGWEKTVTNPEEYHDDFLGLVEALLSDSNNCLNDSNVIFNAVMSSLNSGKRPDEDAPIVHCDVNSVSGGTMSAIATYANSKLKDNKNLHFIFEAETDPNYKNNRLYLYMYYADACESANDGDKIMVYKQILTRGADGVWRADGTFIGYAVVGDFFGGGNSGKDVKTINPYTWMLGAIPTEE